MAKNLEISFLLDFYGDMLTDKQRDVVELYYNEDLSLAEIAAHSGITRQGVRDSIKRAEGQLLEYEERLHLAERFRRIEGVLSSIVGEAEQIELRCCQKVCGRCDREVHRCGRAGQLDPRPAGHKNSKRRIDRADGQHPPAHQSFLPYPYRAADVRLAGKR